MTDPATLAAALMEELSAADRAIRMLRLEQRATYLERRRLECYHATLYAALWAVRDHHDLNASWRYPGPACHPPRPEEPVPVAGCRECGAPATLDNGLCLGCDDMRRGLCPVCGSVQTEAGLCFVCSPAVARMAAGR